MKVRCNTCGNETEFTMLREVFSWNAEARKWVAIEDSDEYTVCDKCDSQDVSEHE